VLFDISKISNKVTITASLCDKRKCMSGKVAVKGCSSSAKIVKEIENDLRGNYLGNNNNNDSDSQNMASSIHGLSQGLIYLINEYNIQTFDSDECDIRDIIRKVTKVHSLIDGIFLFHIDHLYDRYFLWHKHLPKVTPFYAVKSCPDKVVISTLKELGVRFDIASRGELMLLKELDIDGKQMLYANPVKHQTHISHAKAEGVEYFTFDSACELKKISTVYPKAKLILRICVDDSGSVIKFSSKFGCPAKNYDKIFNLAKVLDLTIVGVSFHVGSSCKDPKSFGSAIEEARKVFDLANNYGYKLTVLDIGGGFPGKEEQNELFINIASEINNSLDKYFSDLSNITDLQVWAEPGRFFSTSCATLIFSIIGKNELDKNSDDDNDSEGKKINYTVNSSVYSSASNVIFDYAKLHIEVLGVNTGNDDNNVELYEGIIFGHSCDSVDVLCSGKFPSLEYEDLCFVREMGAYTLASASDFNGFEQPHRVYTYSH
jgi:ornithine decarboxylase